MGRLRLTQADIARMTGLKQSSLSRTLAEEREIGVDEIQAIALAFGTTAAVLVGEALERATEHEVS
jgi:transcriptional regulator with XRE-family HTH domain